MSWTKQPNGEYLHNSGARVYRYAKSRGGNWRAEWGMQMPNWQTGQGGYASMREAKRTAERLLELQS